MATARIFPTSDSLIDFLVQKAKPEEILDYHASEAEEARAEELTEKNKNGTLTADEAEELRQLLERDAFVAALKARALELLSES